MLYIIIRSKLSILWRLSSFLWPFYSVPVHQSRTWRTFLSARQSTASILLVGSQRRLRRHYYHMGSKRVPCSHVSSLRLFCSREDSQWRRCACASYLPACGVSTLLWTVNDGCVPVLPPRLPTASLLSCGFSTTAACLLLASLRRLYSHVDSNLQWQMVPEFWFYQMVALHQLEPRDSEYRPHPSLISADSWLMELAG